MAFHGDTQDGHPQGWYNPATDEWDVDQPVLPYGSGENASSGHSGGATSRERAGRADRDGTTAERQRVTLGWLQHFGAYGITWKELARWANLHHGQASGTLSNLHKVGRIARLAERRDRCFIYTLPEYVNGRETQEQGRKVRLTDAERQTATSAVRLSRVGAYVEPVHLLRIIERLSGEKFLED